MRKILPSLAGIGLATMLMPASAEAKCAAVALGPNGASAAAWNYDSCTEAESQAYDLCRRRAGGKVCYDTDFTTYGWVIGMACNEGNVVVSAGSLTGALSRIKEKTSSMTGCVVKHRVQSEGKH